ncbi:hypothetical protein AB0D78_39155 [Streptomyces avermitilis]|uniref:hypothetical protein n=1 Tax=Streptomyces avermitilis TaxID=33903 RepID=UPI00340C5CA7
MEVPSQDYHTVYETVEVAKMARTVGSGMNSSTSSPRLCRPPGRSPHDLREDAHPHRPSRALTKEISHNAEQLAIFSRAFTRLALIGAAFGLDDALG